MKNLKSTPLWTAIITPFNEDESVDYNSFLRLLKKQEEAGNGIVILGSTGEALNLSAEERKKIVEFTDQQELKVPVLCGVGGFELPETLNWLSFLEQFSLDGYLMVTPLYSKPGDVGQQRWFKTLMDAVTKPCMLYNVPSRTGKELSFKAVQALVEHPNFWSIKEASGDVEKFSQYVQIAHKQQIFSGDDGLLPFFATLGAAGVVSVASNCWPQETGRYVESCLNGRYKEQCYPLWEKACNALFTASNPIPAKALLKQKGWIESASLRLPLTTQDFHELASLKEIDQQITQWFK